MPRTATHLEASSSNSSTSAANARAPAPQRWELQPAAPHYRHALAAYAAIAVPLLGQLLHGLQYCHLPADHLCCLDQRQRCRAQALRQRDLAAHQVCKVAEQQVVLHALVEHALKGSRLQVRHHRQRVCQVAPNRCVALAAASLRMQKSILQLMRSSMLTLCKCVRKVSVNCDCV